MRAILASSLLSFGLTSIAFAGERTMYVAGDSLNVRLCAGSECCVASRLSINEQVQVLEEAEGWARISVYYDAVTERRSCTKPPDEGLVAQWVSLDFLTATVPDGFDPNAWYGLLSDRRIRGIPKVGDYGLKRNDLEIIRRYASQLLLNGTCEAIETGNKSVSREETYYVACKGESKQRYFTTADLDS